jgi:hypothetical protein
MRNGTQYLMLALLVALLIFSGIAGAQEDPTPPGEDDEAATIEIDVGEVAEGAVSLAESAAEVSAGVLEDFLARLAEVPDNEVARVLLVIGGVVLLIAGWRIYEFIIILAGLLMGASVGLALVPDGEMLIQVAALLIGALIGAALAVFLYYVAVFFIGAYIGIILTGAAAVALGVDPVSSLVLLIGGIVGGVLLLALSMELLILLSALVGAQLLTLALGLGAEWTLIFAVAGVIIQLIAARWFGYDIRRRPRHWYSYRRRPV